MLTIDLPENLDIEAASELKAALMAESRGDRAVCIDARRVDRVGTACIQVLLSAGRTLSAEGCPVTIVAPSPALIAAFADLGLVEEFQCWSAE
ncbi:STAS domain-containing protein [Breoghania sp. JC706]|uniref:STAS domain-containing protein n=1 Tax=Breoghania sp. JC706 TaxID=3117732 RepID=UPI003008409E